jgi:hypothetical protein
MPVIQGSTSLAANATIENVITGSQFEFAPYDATCEFAVLGAAVGVVADITTGADVVAESMSVANKAGFPVLPDDFMALDVVRGGERIKLRLRNTTPGAIVVTWTVRIMPLGAMR